MYIPVQIGKTRLGSITRAWYQREIEIPKEWSNRRIGPMHISNFYVNRVPEQEMPDWFEHWATVGAKPMFPCEYGVPFTWAMYRGWYNPVQPRKRKRIFSVRVEIVMK